jgi:hypothetical protein
MPHHQQQASPAPGPAAVCGTRARCTMWSLPRHLLLGKSPQQSLNVLSCQCLPTCKPQTLPAVLLLCVVARHSVCSGPGRSAREDTPSIKCRQWSCCCCCCRCQAAFLCDCCHCCCCCGLLLSWGWVCPVTLHSTDGTARHSTAHTACQTQCSTVCITE